MVLWSYQRKFLKYFGVFFIHLQQCDFSLMNLDWNCNNRRWFSISAVYCWEFVLVFSIFFGNYCIKDLKTKHFFFFTPSNHKFSNVIADHFERGYLWIKNHCIREELFKTSECIFNHEKSCRIQVFKNKLRIEIFLFSIPFLQGLLSKQIFKLLIHKIDFFYHFVPICWCSIQQHVYFWKCINLFFIAFKFVPHW